MSVVFRFKNLDDVYFNSLNEKFIVNNVDGTDPEVKEHIDSLLFKFYKGTNLSHIPTCGCGELKGTLYLGHTCPSCSTEVIKEFDEDLSFLVWLERPNGIDKLICPHMLAVLMNRYKSSKPPISLVEYIIDTNFRIPDKGKTPANRDKLDALDLIMKNRGLKRGYNNFVENFIEYVDLLEDHFGKSRKAEKIKFKEWVRRNHETVFSNYIPIINRSLCVFESVGATKFYDRDILPAIDAVRRFTGIDIRDHTFSQKQNRVAKSLIDLANFYPTYASNSFYGKKAIFRRLISRIKSHKTLRAVIVSDTGPVNYDEVMLPRTAAMALYRPLVLKGLRRKGYSINGAINHVAIHEEIFSQDIDDVLQSIVAATTRGLPISMQRPPELHRGSLQNMRAGIKSDPDDTTIGIPLACCKSFNADFDGDMTIVYAQFTKKIIDNMHYFDLHHSALSMRGPNRLSGISTMTKTIGATIGNWIEE